MLQPVVPAAIVPLLLHADAPGPLHVPRGHAEQELPSCALKKPAPQGAHAPPKLNSPAAQGEQAVAPGTVEKVLRAQGVQAVAPSPTPNSPAAQGVQAEAPGPLKEPGAHREETLVPEVAAKEPARLALHAGEPPLGASEPGAHGVHADAPKEDAAYPAGHATHVALLVALMLAEADPRPHKLQARETTAGV